MYIFPIDACPKNIIQRKYESDWEWHLMVDMSSECIAPTNHTTILIHNYIYIFFGEENIPLMLWGEWNSIEFASSERVVD